MTNGTCIRLQADFEQIRSCRERLKANAESFAKTVQVLALAGNETRLKILFLLEEEQELCPCDLSDILRMSVSAVSQHLRKLKEANIIESRKERQTIHYSLNPGLRNFIRPVFKLIADNKILEAV